MKEEEQILKLIPEENKRFLIVCECGKYALQHDFQCNYDYTMRRYVWKESCAEKLYKEGKSQEENLFYIKGEWWYFTYPYKWYGYLVPADHALRLDRSTALIYPKPRVVNAFGDVYYFCFKNNCLDKLQQLVGDEKFKRMQGKSIERTLKKT